MFDCDLCSETFDCSFYNYYRIQNNTKEKIMYPQSPKECDFCAFEANGRRGVALAAFNKGTEYRETLVTSYDIIRCVANNNFESPEGCTETGIFKQLKGLTPPLKEEPVSPTFQNNSLLTWKKEIEETHPAEDPAERPFKSERQENLANKRGERPFKCNLCPFSTFREDIFQEHEDRHKSGRMRFQCPTCPYAFCSRGNLLRHLVMHTGEVRFRCPTCSFTTADSGSLKLHERRHTGEKPFRCSYCKFRSASGTNLRIHKRRHRGEKMYKCSYCEYRCVVSNNLRQHEQQRHLGIKPYACQYCPYRSAQSGNVVEHERRHRGEKPFECSHCHYRAARKSDVTRHLKSRHK